MNRTEMMSARFRAAAVSARSGRWPSGILVEMTSSSTGTREGILHRDLDRVTLLGEAAEQATLPIHSGIVARGAPGTRIGKGFRSAEMLVAHFEIDAGPGVILMSRRGAIQDGVRYVEVDASECVDQINESAQVDQGVIVDWQVEKPSDRLHQSLGARVGGLREIPGMINRPTVNMVEPVVEDAIFESLREASRQWDCSEIARNAEECRLPGRWLHGCDDHGVGAQAATARAGVAADEQDGDSIVSFGEWGDLRRVGDRRIPHFGQLQDG